MNNYFDRETLTKLVQSAVILLVALGLFAGLKGRILAFAQWANLSRLALTPVRLALRYSILVVAFLLIMGRWGFPVDNLLTLLGTVLGLVAIGFVAMWSVLSNILCTLVLVIFKPFSIGDEIELPANNAKGKVRDLSLIFTTLESAPGETVMVPNNLFFQGLFKRRIGTVTMDLGQKLEQPEKPSPEGALGALTNPL